LPHHLRLPLSHHLRPPGGAQTTVSRPAANVSVADPSRLPLPHHLRLPLSHHLRLPLSHHPWLLLSHHLWLSAFWEPVLAAAVFFSVGSWVEGWVESWVEGWVQGWVEKQRCDRDQSDLDQNLPSSCLTKIRKQKPQDCKLS